MSTDPESYGIHERTPTDHEREITATLEAFQALHGRPVTTVPCDHKISRTVLDCCEEGVLTAVAFADTDGMPYRILEWFTPKHKPRRIYLSPAGGDALCAWWRAQKEGG